MRRDLIEVHQVLEMPVVVLVHHEVRLPEVLLLEHRPHRRVERDRVAAHHPHALRDQMARRLCGHTGEVGLVPLLRCVRARARVDQDDVALLQLVADLVECLVDLVGEDARPLLLVAEVEPHAVGEAVFERDALDPWSLGAADVLDRVAVRADVVVLDDDVARRQRRGAELRGSDPLGELRPAFVQHQHRRRHAREREHVRVYRHREVHQARHDSTSTTPLVPFTRTRSPLLIRSVATDVPTTAGIPNSRATTAGCAATPPASVTSPAIFVNRTTHAGLVIWQTRISPFCTWSNSSSEATLRATPSTTPGEAPSPCTSSTFSGGGRWNFSGKPQSDQ